MTNFDYLLENEVLRELYDRCHEAEIRQKSDPVSSAIYARASLEYLVNAVYDLYRFYDEQTSERMQLKDKLEDYHFSNFINNDERLAQYMRFVRLTGNRGAHRPETVRQQDSYFAVFDLYMSVGMILKKLRFIESFPMFDKTLIPERPEIHVAPDTTTTPSQTLIDNAPTPSDEPIVTPAPSPEELSEAETRRMFIDMMLMEAGWEVMEHNNQIVPGKACIEIEVDGMPNNGGKGYADYVLFGEDCKPLAVIEAKRTSKDAEVGRQQAKLYAECLDRKYGVKPVIYYTNGLEIYVIDGLNYPPRKLYSFHSADDLQRMIQKRGRADIIDMQVNPEIAGRDYQQTAIKAVCEHFNAKHRRSLLVMATGTGKTRTSIGLVDVLMRNNWAKRVLFLADRTSLVSQAFKNFEKLLPNETKEVLNETKNPELNKRITFSTYQTLIKFIDAEEKKLSIGAFDLIIIDEAHRSIFGKYMSIVDYFDALVLGMTATPRDDVDHNTYELMQLDDEPNFSYEYEQAVKEKYLVDYTPIVKESKILKRGIRYQDLTEEEKSQLEAVWEYEKVKKDLDPDSEFSRDITSSEIDKYIYNLDTIDKVIDTLMEEGQKVESGDKLGKSIIFAANHKHAELIVERFNHLYPRLGSEGFCQLIDYSINYSQSLIDKFSVTSEMPQIAVSVDMLDTGIDVPEVLNLVFFKVVRSKIKFWQMMGRGTRLCEGVFGEGEPEDVDKKTFYVFDWCSNLQFFTDREAGSITMTTPSLSQKLFETRLDIAVALQAPEYQEDEYAKGFHDDLKTIMRRQVEGLNDFRIQVRKHMKYVVKYRNADNWTFVSPVEALDIKREISGLFVPEKEDEFAKKFDLIVLHRQLSLVDDAEDGGESWQKKIINIASILEKKCSIPQIMDNIDTIREVQSAQFWENVSLGSLERIRIKLRELIHYLQKTSDNKSFIVNISDTVHDSVSGHNLGMPNMTYKQRVMDYLHEHTDNEVVCKIFNLEKLTNEDLHSLEELFWNELGTKSDFDEMTEGKPYKGNIAAFIRTISKVDSERALQIYRNFVSDADLTSQQEMCLRELIEFVCVNGDIRKENIRDHAPLNQRNYMQIFGQNASFLVNFIDELHNVIQTA